jgi:hypothetical protein
MTTATANHAELGTAKETSANKDAGAFGKETKTSVKTGATVLRILQTLMMVA